MAITSALVLLAVVWFLTLFVVLPLRLKTQGDVGRIVPGTHAGAPDELNLRGKMLLTTLVALVVWALICAVILSGIVSVRDIDWFNRMSAPAGETGG